MKIGGVEVDNIVINSHSIDGYQTDYIDSEDQLGVTIKIGTKEWKDEGLRINTVHIPKGISFKEMDEKIISDSSIHKWSKQWVDLITIVLDELRLYSSEPSSFQLNQESTNKYRSVIATRKFREELDHYQLSSKISYEDAIMVLNEHFIISPIMKC